MGRALHGICAAVTTLCWWSQLHQSHQRCLKSLIATWAALRPAAPITPPPARKQKRGMEVHLCHTPLPSLCRPPGGSWLPALLTRVGSTPTQVQARNWGSVARVGWCWPGEVQLVQRHPSMEDVLPTELCELAVPGPGPCPHHTGTRGMLRADTHGTHPTGQPEDPLQVWWRQDVPANDGCLEPWGIVFDAVKH